MGKRYNKTALVSGRTSLSNATPSEPGAKGSIAQTAQNKRINDIYFSEQNELSVRAKFVFKQLDEETRAVIRKENALKANRNERIREVKGKGVNIEILAELTGLNRSTLYHITNPKDDVPEFLRQEVIDLTEAFNGFRNTLLGLLRQWQ